MLTPKVLAEGVGHETLGRLSDHDGGLRVSVRQIGEEGFFCRSIEGTRRWSIKRKGLFR